MFQVYSQHLDPASGFHTIELRNEHGAKHLVQIAIGHQGCPACGAVYPKSNTGEIDPSTMIEKQIEMLNRSHLSMAEYAAKHRLRMKQGPGVS